MKYILKSIILVAFVISSTASFASMSDLKAGGKTILTSPLQVRDHVRTELDHPGKFKPFALVGGFLKGTFYMGKQIVDGTWTVVTSPLPK